ncbi:MAG: VWA domain-containing protein [Bryobacteraceae bacterium]|nr:VWA domain-containing protein [Bryobacteraceae bacterium]MDW8378986.1 VWA domain-containing protein [Bryobacterales bacterium]
MRSTVRVILAVGFVISLLSAAQTPKKDQAPPEDLPTIRVDVDLVNVLFSVRDKKGAYVANLTKDDFQVFEDGKEQQIRVLTRESDLPLTIGLLVDVSRSQENLIEIERRAAMQFFRQVLRPKDMAFLIAFGSEAELLQDYTNSAKMLSEALGQLRVNSAVGGLHPSPVPTIGQPRGTILFDAVYLAADEKLKKEVGRKAMVLITDGVDVGSRVRLRDAIEMAHKADAIIYSIQYIDWSVYGGFGNPGDGDLRRMSEETGGRLYRVDRKYTLERILDEIQTELRSQYALAYSPTNPAKDGGFRRLEIRTKNKDLKVQARKGYYALPQSAH